jgi:two-component system, OmpR family, sensor histidine kinase TctE
MSSIRVRLLKRLAGPILLINLATAGLAYLLAWTPAQLAFDQGLADSAAVLAVRLRESGVRAVQSVPVARPDGDLSFVALRDAAGRHLAGDAAFPPLRPGQGLRVYDARMQGMPVRVAALAVQAGGKRFDLAVARTIRQRQQVQAATVRSLLLLEGLVTLGLIGAAWFSVTNGLLPLSRMRANLNGRDAGDFAPIGQDGVPYELAPVVAAFNDLLGKVQDVSKVQQDFLADMAHQLRTPLAGLKLQLEWLGERHAHEPDTAESVRLMRVANERMIRQTNQLLALARATPAGIGKARLERLDLAALVAESVQYFVGEAARKGLDIGFDLRPARVTGDALRLRDLIDNLVDNAVRYTPSAGAVTVRTENMGAGAVLVVEDSGPGIPPSKRALVFNRFVRLDDKMPGSGLGLAIVRDIALAHRARITMHDMPGGTGMRFEVRFPAV